MISRAELLRLVNEHIFDLPIGEDVTYSRGYSAGVAAARESLREAVESYTARPAADGPMRCPICKGPMADEMAVFVDLEGTPTLVCFICDERAVEAANVEGDDDAAG